MMPAHEGERAELSVTGAPGSLEYLCSASLRGCEAMQPLVAAIYEQLVLSPSTSELKKEKRDNSAFTIADGLVQRLITDVLYSGLSFRDVVGEEDDTDDDGEDDWFRVQGLAVPTDLRPLVESTRASVQSLAENHLSSATKDVMDYGHITVFIDPIDGTREFSSGKGEQCSICIGFANEDGKAVGGVVYRPLSKPAPTWVAGAQSEGYAAHNFSREARAPAAGKGGLLTTNGSISPFLESLIDELQVQRLKSGGAGNKMMLLLENSIFFTDNNSVDGSMIYIQDRGISRWDSCAAEACLEAFGGRLVKLTHLVGAEEETVAEQSEQYTYLASGTNLDFIPGSAHLTKYNFRSSGGDLLPSQKAVDPDEVKPYSNLCGLVALGREWSTDEGRKRITEAIRRAAKKNPPSFD